MIEIQLFKDAQGRTYGFRSEGHADYDDFGRDIVCAAVSVLELNLANSTSQFTSARFSCQVNEKNGTFEYRLADVEDREAGLLLSSCLLGLERIGKEYGSNYLTIRDQEV